MDALYEESPRSWVEEDGSISRDLGLVMSIAVAGEVPSSMVDSVLACAGSFPSVHGRSR